MEIREFEIKKFFEISKIPSHDIGDLKNGNEYDYVTRSVLNRGISHTTGFIDNDSLCDLNTFSLELMNMTFFWRERKWYAGQFMRIVKPLHSEIIECWEYFETIFSGITKLLKTVLVRDVDTVFLDQKFEAPILIDKSGNPVLDESKKYHSKGFIPNWEFIKEYVNIIKQLYIPTLEAANKLKMNKYLKAAGLKEEDLDKQTNYKEPILKEFVINDLFKVYTGRDVIIRDTEKGSIPLVSHTNVNNGVTTYIKQLNHRILFNHKKTIALADRGVFWASAHEEDFHIGTRVKALELLDGEKTMNVLFYLATSINGLQALFTEYLINATDKLPFLKIWLPIKMSNNEAVIDLEHKYSPQGYIPDWDFMDLFIEDIKKRTILGFRNEQKVIIDSTRVILGV